MSQYSCAWDFLMKMGLISLEKEVVEHDLANMRECFYYYLLGLLGKGC